MRSISTLNDGHFKLVDKFMYLGSSVLSTESDVNIYLMKTWTIIDRLLIIWKSDLFSKIKWDFFQAVVVLILLYGCTRLMLRKCTEKKLDGNYTRMLWAILNKSSKQYLMKHQLYGHLPSISKNIQVRWTRLVRHCSKSKDKLRSDIFLCTPIPGSTSVPGCSLENLLRVMHDKDRGWEEESVREIHAVSMTCWWWRLGIQMEWKLIKDIDWERNKDEDEDRRKILWESSQKYWEDFEYLTEIRKKMKTEGRNIEKGMKKKENKIEKE